MLWLFQVYIELSVRADKDAPENTIISLQLMVEFGDTLVATKDTNLMIKELTDDNNPATNYTLEAKARNKNSPRDIVIGNYTDVTQGGTINITVREFKWVPFFFVIPPDGVWPVKLFIESPVRNGRSVFHLKTARFPAANCTEWPDLCSRWNGQGDSQQYGDNVLGVHQWIDIERTYTMQKLKSSRITTHMVYDQMVIDFGFLTNTGL